MAAVNFPSSPATNDIFTSGGISWKWNGSTWVAQSATTLSGYGITDAASLSTNTFSGTQRAPSFYTSATPSSGLGLWNSAPTTYGIYLAPYSDSNAGRLDSTSDYNIYYKIGSGANRGHVFKGNSGAVVQITGGGQIYVSPTSSGTAPFVLSANATAVVANLNADKLDGLDSTAFALVGSGNSLTGNQTTTGYFRSSAVGEAFGMTAGTTTSDSFMSMRNSSGNERWRFGIDGDGTSNIRIERFNSSGVYVDTPFLVSATDGSNDFVLKNGAWYNGADGSGRLYFTASGATYYKSANGTHEFRNAADAARFTIDTSGNVTMVGKLGTVASTTSAAGINIPHGTAPTSPVNGDLWTTTADMLVRINSATKTIAFTDSNITGSAATLTTGRTLAITGDLTWTSPSFNGSGNVTAAGTLATVNSNVGSFGSATQAVSITVNAKGLVTAASHATITPAWSSITSKPTTLSGYGITDAMPLSGGSFTGNISIDGLTPVFTFKETDRVDGSGYWRIVSSGGSLTLRRNTAVGSDFSTEVNDLTFGLTGQATFSTTPRVGSDDLWHAGNDGASSGLDADLLDGQQGSYYTDIPTRLGYTPLNRAVTNTSDWNTKTNNQMSLISATTNGASGGSTTIGLYIPHNSGAYGFNIAARNGAFYLRTEENGTWGSWNTIWHTGNDGSGSGLDADLLDGQHGSYYQSASNLNAGTVPDARITGAYTGITTLTTTDTFTNTKAGAGDNIYLNGTTSNWIKWSTAGVAAPALTTRSAGTKILLYDALSGAQVDFAIGIDSGTLWNSVPSTSSSFKWYGATTLALTVTGAGALTAAGTITGALFSGSGASLTALNASNLSSGTLPDARLSGTYTGVTIKTDGGNTLYTTPNTGTSSSLARTVTNLADYRNNTNTGTGAIVFIAPTNATDIMHLLNIQGNLYGADTIDMVVQMYRSANTFGNFKKITRGTADVQVRFATNASGYTCVILGDVGTVWSYPHFSITKAMFSHGSIADSYCSGWTVALETSLAAYSNLSSTVSNNTQVGGGFSGDGSALTALNASNVSSGTLAAARMPALTGDITTSAGAVATTLATVNSNVGSFGSTSAVPIITVNAKGLITAVTTGALGTAAVVNTGTSGATIPLLNGTNTWSGKQTTLASAIGTAGFNIPHGTAPTTPTNGDIWTTTSGLLAQINSATKTVAFTDSSITGSAATLTTGRTLAITGDLTWTSPSFNGSGNVTAAGTLATVNSNVGAFGSTTAVPVITVNAKGLITAVSTAALGTAAVKATGTSGNTVPLLDGTNTWTNNQTGPSWTASSYVLGGNIYAGPAAILGWQSSTNLTNPANGTLKINTSASALGTLLTGGIQTNIVTKTGNYTLTITDKMVLCDTTSAGFTVTLPTAVGIAGQIFIIKKIASANMVTIATTSSQTIDGLAGSNYNIYAQYELIAVQSDNANWVIVDRFSAYPSFTAVTFSSYILGGNIYAGGGGLLGWQSSTHMTNPDNGTLKINTSASALGRLQTGGVQVNVAAKTANYTATTTDYLITCDAASGSFTITLPTAVGATGQTYIIKKITAANTITMATTSSQTIDGAAAGGFTLTSQWDTLQVVSNGANWIRVDKSTAAVKVGTQTLPVNAGAMTPRTTNGAAAGNTETTTNKVMITVLDFDQTTAEYAQFMVPMPKSWNEGTVTAQFYWTATTTGNVVWGIQGLARSDDDALDTAFGTAVTVTDSVTAANDLMISSVTSAMTIGGTPAENDLVFFQVYRDAASGSDTLAADARLLSVKVFVTYNLGDDS